MTLRLDGPGADTMARQYDDALRTHADRWTAAWQARSSHHPPQIRFDRPLATLPVSLTGERCALKCAHCNGVYLRHMRPIAAAHPGEARSYLISGGCDGLGRVPVQSHLEHVAALRDGGRLNWHVGMIPEETLQAIAPLVDLISFDVVGDRATAQEVYGLDLDLDDYMREYDMLRRYAPVVPHVTIGLRAGRLSGEWQAVEALAAREAQALVFIVLIPTAGTQYADCEPPTLSDVAQILLGARLRLPQARLYLGCMRPRGVYRQAVDDLAVRAGINVIVNPARTAERAAEELGLDVSWGEECCALD